MTSKVSRPLLTASVVFVVALLLAGVIVWRSESIRIEQQRSAVAVLATNYGNTIESNIERALSATYPLAAIIRRDKGEISDFTAIATELLPYYQGASALALAPGGVVTEIVPLAGNEGAIGHNLLADPGRNKEAILARDTGKLTLAGPFDLVQGGTGAAGRLPIYLEDATGKPQFWGFSSVVIRFPETLERANLGRLVELGYNYALWRTHPDTGEKQVIAASSAAALDNPVEFPVEVPNATWTFSVAPADGWGAPGQLAAKIVFALMACLGFASLAWLTATLERRNGELAAAQERSEEALQRLTSLTTTLERRNRDLAAAQVRSELATAAAGIGIWSWDYGGNRLSGDERMRQMFAAPAETMSDDDIRDLWQMRTHPDDRGTAGDMFMQALSAGTDGKLLYRFILPDGQQRYIQSLWRWERDGEGKPVRMVGANLDVTEQKLYELMLEDTNALLEQRVVERTNELQETVAELQRANAGKDAFLAAISHELRTPLTGILTVSELLEMEHGGPLTPEQQRYLGLIRSSGTRLLDLVDAVLLYSQLLAGTPECPLGPVALAGVCESSVRTAQEKADAKGQSIAVEVVPPALAIRSNAGLLARLLAILLDNAVKFTPQGGAIGVQAEYVQGTGDARLVVWDTGVGIAPEQMAYLFKPFSQVDQTLARRFEGIGLGLATVHELAKVLGGSVEVESALGQGTRFTVTLPVENGAA